ncbi:thioesterase family protein [Gordonia sp. HY442]|uniref:acyl-CoA thioesterase n=1 Tax=Gordonia zhenghanii TaxID=2911516 RepID=UPI001F1AC4E4|nr:thioesterase family protein [Gordonia zhenghanii]MCF8604123.1 thioesterase family protein [Gordonia zhenghanii]
MSDEENVTGVASATGSAERDAKDPLIVEVALRWGDQDSLGHVNNVQIARIVEEARVRAMSTWFGEARGGFWVVLARQEIEFASILHYDERPVRVQVWITRIGNSSVDFGCRLIAPTGQVAALAETTLAAVDPKTSRPMPWPESAAIGFHEHLGDRVPLRRRR